MTNRKELDLKYLREFQTLLKDLKSFANSNFEHFRAYEDANSMRFVKSCAFLMEHIEQGISPGIEYVIDVARYYDFSEQHPANGFRSFVRLIEKCCFRLLTLTRYIASNRRSLIFRAENNSKELESYVKLLAQLRACLHYMEKYMSCSSTWDLVAEEITEEQFEIMQDVEALSREPFYGTCLGFHLCSSMLQPIVGMHIILASYSEGYNKSSALLKLASTLMSSGKFIMSPEERARKVIKATLEGDIAFCKSFWSLSENYVLHNIQKVVGPQVAVDKVFAIPPDPVRVPLVKNPAEHLTIHSSSCPDDRTPVMVRLISYLSREGQMPAHTSPVSDCLLIHVHGGGFVAQSSASHSAYLRHWAKDLNVPILSIDYTLAPESHYPKQVDEVLFAYCWAVSNCSLLGSTGKIVCFVGDSAGANLSVSTALKISHLGLRKPDGVLSIYGSFLVRYSPSPSRLMAILDPILLSGLLSKCVAAYMGISDDFVTSVVKDSSIKKNVDTKTSQGHSTVADDDGSTREQNRAALVVSDSNDNSLQLEDSKKEPFVKYVHRHKKEDKIETNKEEDVQAKERIATNATRSDTAVAVKTSVSDETVGASDIVRDTDRVKLFNVTPPLDFKSSSNEADRVGGKKPRADKRLREQQRQKILSRKRHNSMWTMEFDKTEPDKKNVSFKSEPCSVHNLNEASSESSRTSSKDKSNNSQSSGSYGSVSSGCKVDGSKLPSCVSRAFDVPAYAAFTPKQGFTYDGMKSLAVINKDPFLSPVYASPELLAKLCPVYFVACHFDPLLDESIHLAKMIKSSGGQVTLDLVDDLPHGFLNFISLSKEAHHAAQLCVSRLREMFSKVDCNKEGDDDNDDDDDVYSDSLNHVVGNSSNGDVIENGSDDDDVDGSLNLEKLSADNDGSYKDASCSSIVCSTNSGNVEAIDSGGNVKTPGLQQ